MRAAQFYGTEEMRVEDVEEPSPEAGEILVDVAACGICGSDLHFYEDGFGDFDGAVTLGHEASGTIIETGDGVDLEVGTEIVLSPHTPCMECWACESGMYNLCLDLNATSARPGGYAEKVVERAENAIPLPAGVDVEDAAIAQPLGVGLHAVLQSPLSLGDSALIVGTGPIGLGAVAFADAIGASPILASEPQDARREVAADFGADVLIDPTEEDPQEVVEAETDIGVDVAYEAVGIEPAFETATEAVRPAGNATIIGVFTDDIGFGPGILTGKQLAIEGSRSHQLGPKVHKEYGIILDQIASGQIDPGQYVTSRIDLEDIVEEGFETLLTEGNQERKILVRP